MIGADDGWHKSTPEARYQLLSAALDTMIKNIEPIMVIPAPRGQ
jgi:hypothetical protein